MERRLTRERLLEVLSYDADSGHFTWRMTLSRRAMAGRRAGARKDGYIVIRIDGVLYRAHQLAWLCVHGMWPGELDHIDGDRANNALANLRPCDRAHNSMNARRSKANTSGYKGVYFSAHHNRWAFDVSYGSSRRSGIRFASAEEAAEACRIARQELHGEFARHE